MKESLETGLSVHVAAAVDPAKSIMFASNRRM